MLKFLNKCAQIEETAALIYHEFSGNAKCDETLALVWEKMARDEEDHAKQLKLAMRLPVRDIFKSAGANSPNPETLNELACSILVRAKEDSYTLLNMLKDAVLLEKEFRKIHATYAIEFKDPSLLETFKRLARADEEHLKALDDYLKDYKKKHRPSSP